MLTLRVWQVNAAVGRYVSHAAQDVAAGRPLRSKATKPVTPKVVASK